MLSKEHISAQLTTKWAARNLIYKEETGSTNDDARILGEEGAAHGTLVVADMQKNRTWLQGKKLGDSQWYKYCDVSFAKAYRAP